MDRIDQMDSNGLHSTNPSQMVNWSNGVLLLEHSACKEIESNGSNRSNGVEWTPFDKAKSNGQRSNGVLLLEHSGCKASESNGSNRSNGVEWTPFD